MAASHDLVIRQVRRGHAVSELILGEDETSRIGDAEHALDLLAMVAGGDLAQEIAEVEAFSLFVMDQPGGKAIQPPHLRCAEGGELFERLVPGPQDLGDLALFGKRGNGDPERLNLFKA